MKTKTTIAFSCPKTTAQVIDEYSCKLGISRSACITMMCNAYIIADSITESAIRVERKEGVKENAD